MLLYQALRHVVAASFAVAVVMCVAPAVAAAVPVVDFEIGGGSTHRPGQPVTFVGTIDPVPGEAVSAVTWDFGDGESQASPVAGQVVVTHVYQSGRVAPYPVELMITFGGGQLAITHWVTINTPPSVSLVFSPSTPLVDEPIVFRAPAHDAEEPASGLDYQWSFGGGAGATTGPEALWSYSNPGARAVTVTVTDSSGEWDSAGRAVVVATPDRTRRLRMLTPFPLVRLLGSLTPGGAEVRRLAVRAPRGSLILVRCRGRDCPVRRSRRLAGGGEPKPTLVLRGKVGEDRVRRFEALERRFRAGTVIEVLVWRANRIGKYTRFVIRRGGAPKRVDRCLRPGAEHGSRCPPG